MLCFAVPVYCFVLCGPYVVLDVVDLFSLCEGMGVLLLFILLYYIYILLYISYYIYILFIIIVLIIWYPSLYVSKKKCSLYHIK